MFNRVRHSYDRANRWVNAKRSRAQMVVQATVAINLLLVVIIMRNRSVNQSIARSINGDIDLANVDPDTRAKLHQDMADFMLVTKMRKDELRAERSRLNSQSNNQSDNQSINQPSNPSIRPSAHHSIDQTGDRFHRIDQSAADSVDRTYSIDGREKKVTFVKNRPHIYPTGSFDRSDIKSGFIDARQINQPINPTSQTVHQDKHEHS